MKLSRRIEEQILLLKIRHGDQEAFAAIYDQYVDALFRFVVFRVRSEELAQDITSELFLKVLNHLRKYLFFLPFLLSLSVQVERAWAVPFFSCLRLQLLEPDLQE